MADRCLEMVSVGCADMGSAIAESRAENDTGCAVVSPTVKYLIES